MGCFDSVWFRCPNGCSDELEAQSKAAECVLANFDSDDVPLRIAADILGEWVSCHTCKESFKIRGYIPTTVRLTLE